ncbi:hypothetical protein N9063_00940, partial [Deltaproteobacteria bacterium]|nr:hypothetical protein [Deltaproteobacteria bacterium]
GKNYILYNRLTDETDGNYNIDLPWGGPAWIIGNIIEQGNGSDNEVMMTYGVEAHWVLRIKDGGTTQPLGYNRIIGATSGAQCVVNADRFCQLECPGEGTGTWATNDRATGIQCLFNSGIVDSTPDWIAGESLNLYQNNGTTLIERNWATVRSAADPPTYELSDWKPPFNSRTHRAYLVNNTIINNNSDYNPRLVNIHPAAELFQMTNNLIYNTRGDWGLTYSTYGGGLLGQASNMTISDQTIFRDKTIYDFNLVGGATAVIDRGTSQLVYDGFDATPIMQYVHPCSSELRPLDGALDLGAFEYSGTLP